MTGLQILESALDLCALHSGNGVFPSDIDDLQARAKGLLNVLIAEVTPLHERLTGSKTEIQKIGTLEEPIRLCDGLQSTYLPFALASLLIADEDAELYAILRTHAEQQKKQLLQDGVARRHGILEVYA